MKILFQTRFDSFKNTGGDTLQLLKTKEELEKLGCEVVIDCNYKINLSTFDIVHVFQLDWTPEPYLQALNAKRQGKKIVVSPIHHSEKEVVEFEERVRYNFRILANMFLKKQEQRDVLKNIYRSVFDTRKLYPTLLSVIEGFRNEQRSVLKFSDAVLVQTRKELEDIKRDFEIDVYAKGFVIPNGVGEKFFLTEQRSQAHETQVLGDGYFLTVGRIEPRKNIIAIVNAVDSLRKKSNLDLNLVVVGAMNKNNWDYYYHFLSRIKGMSFVKHVERVPYDNMPGLYRKAKVYVSASFFETSGLTLLEAAVCGCQVVARNGDTGERVREYLLDFPFYCDPFSMASISDALYEALNSKKKTFSPLGIEKFKWSAVAKETLSIYNGLIGRA
ncbi:MAG: glycosyltransferase [Patescibacteria group bacterium]